jgi:hypothetical protein
MKNNTFQWWPHVSQRHADLGAWFRGMPGMVTGTPFILSHACDWAAAHFLEWSLVDTIPARICAYERPFDLGTDHDWTAQNPGVVAKEALALGARSQESEERYLLEAA